jgi:hypothetical protein
MTPSTPSTTYTHCTATAFARHELAARAAHAIVLLLTILVGALAPMRSVLPRDPASPSARAEGRA